MHTHKKKISYMPSDGIQGIGIDFNSTEGICSCGTMTTSLFGWLVAGAGLF
jgi:hypothetical protein